MILNNEVRKEIESTIRKEMIAISEGDDCGEFEDCMDVHEVIEQATNKVLSIYSRILTEVGIY